MDNQYSFITRIAGVLYDPYVEKHFKMPELRDALSDGQLRSKLWLIDEFDEVMAVAPPGKQRVAVMGGWVGLLPLLMFTKGKMVSVTSFDIDERANTLAEKFNWGYDFKAVNKDMYEVDYSEFDVIINTSSEHIPDIRAWAKSLPPDKTVIVQNNNFVKGNGHVSCVKDEDELEKLLDLSDVFSSGRLKFPMYSRFMVVGFT